MAYDTLVKEAKDLPEDMIEQVIEFIRFLKYTSKKEQTNYSIDNTITSHRSVNPLANDFIAIAEDFDETPAIDAFYWILHNKKGQRTSPDLSLCSSIHIKCENLFTLYIPCNLI